MRSPQAALRTAVPAVLALIVVEAVVSIAARWPHQFNGAGRRDEVLADFLSGGGTALAPPLWLVLVLAVVGAGLYLRGVPRVVATVLLVPVVAVLTVGVLGEVLAGPTPDVPRAVQLLGGVVDGLCCLTLLGLAVASLATMRRVRADRRVPAGSAGAVTPE
jgi:hypothetical protein